MSKVILWIFLIYLIYKITNKSFEYFTNKLPTSGAEPKWEPEAWNSDSIIKYNNCYAYFLDDPVITRDAKPQPGYFGLGQENVKKRNKEYGKYSSCTEMNNRILSDNKNIYISDENKPCSPGYYKGFLAISPGNDYHFYRQDSNGYFSHKRGNNPVSNIDSNGELIINPRIAGREYPNYDYYESCNYYCIPKNEKIITNSK